MSHLILDILPFAVGAAINPGGILVVVALLATNKRTALFLTAGFCAAFIAFGVVVLAFGLQLELKPGLTSAIIDFVGAGLIVWVGVRAWRKGRRPPEGDPAKKHRRLGPAGGFAAGLVLAVVDFSSLIPFLVALKEMVIAGTGSAAAWTALAVFLVIMLTPMVLPVALTYAAPKAAAKVLDPLGRVLKKHGQQIIAVVCFVLAAYLVFKGARGI